MNHKKLKWKNYNSNRGNHKIHKVAYYNKFRVATIIEDADGFHTMFLGEWVPEDVRSIKDGVSHIRQRWDEFCGVFVDDSMTIDG